jgi:hypothetical protein
MIDIPLPLRPRTDGDKLFLEYLTTPISVIGGSGVPVLLMTTKNFPDNTGNIEAKKYTDYLSDLSRFGLSVFQRTFCDDQASLDDYLQKVVSTFGFYTETHTCLVCQCGKYEELTSTKSFNTRRLQNGACTYCKKAPEPKEVKGLYTDIPFGSFFENDRITHNFPWVQSDWNAFLQRHTNISGLYKMSKESEPWKVTYTDTEYGIRHQFVWAVQICHAASTLGDFEITLHFVERVKDLAFFISALALMIEPRLKIHLKGCPTVWLEQEKKFQDITRKDILAIQQMLLSKRKEVGKRLS